MFDFTKEVVINSKNMFKAVTEGARGPKFNVHGGGDYFAKYVVSGKIYKTEAQKGELAVLKIDADALVGAMTSEAKHFTLNIELGLDRDARQDWTSAVYLFKKPMVVDAYASAWGEAPAEASASKNAYNLGLLLKSILTDYKFVHVFTADDSIPEEFEVEAPAAGEVLVIGSDYNVKVRKIGVYEYRCDVRCEGSSEEPVAIYAGRPEDAPEWAEYKANVVEFGTYNYLLHNLRMPTYENYRFTSPAAVEMPMAGAEYVQYSFLYCVPRPGLGGLSVAGQFNHSTTTHVFFVQAGEVAEAFESELLKAGMPDPNESLIEVTPGYKDSESENDDIHEINILPDSFATSSSVDGDQGSTDFGE